MNAHYLMFAGTLCFVVAAAHSILGEWLIFRRLRVGGVVPTCAAPPLLERHVRILWATWHATTAFGCALGVLLIDLASPAGAPGRVESLVDSIAVAMLVAAALVLIATRGRHPGWIGLLGVAVLAWLA
jgi:hypothetical protein